MKVVVTSSGNNATSTFDLRFGRAAWFCLFDSETKKTEFIENGFKNGQGGVGSKVSEMLIEKGVEKIISGDFGPKAKGLLDKFNVQMVVIQDENKTIKEVLDSLK